MPRSRMLSQIDDELMHAKRSLSFWHEQLVFLADTPMRQYAERQVKLREAEIKQLVDVQESLAGAKDA